MGKKKKISEMTPEEQAEQRRSWAEDQAQRREEKRKAAYIPTAEEWRDEFAATEHHKTLNLHVKQFSAKVEEELGHKVGNVRVKTGHGLYDYFDDDGDYTVDRVARTLLGLKKNWVQEVRDPNGEQVSGAYFIDGCSFASSVIESVYRHDLKRSSIFAASLRELLELLNKRYARLRDQQTAVVRTELAGNYVYEPPVLPELKPEPKLVSKTVEAKPEPFLPGVVRAPIPNVDWSQLNRDLDEKARRYLDGIK
jgi:hypothetical protein